MKRSAVLLFSASAWIAFAGSSHAATAQKISMPAQDLATALNRLSSLTGTSFLYDSSLVAGLKAPRIRNSPSLDDTLRRLLASSAIGFQHIDAGTVILSRTRPADPPAASDDAAIPEILVVGRRFLNLDIPRSENDIQPYQVIGGEAIERSGSQTADEFFKNRLTSNTITLSANQAPIQNNAGTQSQIDLRGLGSENTLILVDGHRMPSFPAAGAFLQSNVNGIPVSAIERVEILSSTAGGIYGPGATGGVVNIVLKHDPKAFNLAVTKGVTSRGDAPNWRIDARWGFESRDGRTRVALTYSHENDSGLDQGDRPYVQAARDALSKYGNYLIPPTSPSLNIHSFNATLPLVLKPQYGGQNLGAAFTTIPLSALGAPDMIAQLIAGAGQVDTRLSPDGEGAKQSSLTSFRNDGLDLSIRQRIGARVEIYADLLASQSVGTATGTLRTATNQYGLGLLSANSPGNPFATTIVYSFPEVGLDTRLYNRTRTYRATGGLIVDLPHHWRADLDIAGGGTAIKAVYPPGDILADYVTPTPNAFVQLANFPAALQAAAGPLATMRTSDRMIDGNVKLAGPLFQLPAGPATMTVSGEVRSEFIDGVNYAAALAQGGRLFTPADSGYQKQDSQSVYDEVRLPLVPTSSSFIPLRGLEFQLAGRMDHFTLAVPPAIISRFLVQEGLASSVPAQLRAQHTTWTFTLGSRIEPIAGVLVRASFATGYLPPTAADIQGNYGSIDVYDPKRKGDETGEVLANSGGTTTLRPEKSKNVSVGMVLTPNFIPGLRISADYTRLKLTRQPSDIEKYDADYFLDNEDSLPNHIFRAPLTEADRQAGYTAGRIIEIDAGTLSLASTSVQTVDLDASYSTSTPLGTIKIFGHGTWEPTFRTKRSPTSTSYSTAGYFDGPIVWKANAGASWSKGALSLGTNVQFYSSYRIDLAGYDAGLAPSANIYRDALQGSNHIPKQIYTDLYIGWSDPGNDHRVKMSYLLTVNNLFDKHPPAYFPAINPDRLSIDKTTVGYSYYGDPRGRRFQLTVGVDF